MTPLHPRDSTYIVTTDESVTGTYIVTAATADQARAKFAQRGIDWEGVEQNDYMAYAVEVREVRMDGQ